MKKIYLHLFSFGALLLGTTACSLNELPTDGLQDNQVTSTVQGLTAATAGNYSFALKQQFIRNLYYMNELPGDNVSLSGTTTDALFYSYTYGHLPNQLNSYEIWQECYRIIAGANRLIPKIDENTSEEFSQLKGENIFLRAWAHLILVDLFAKPYTLQGVNPATELGIPVVLAYSPDEKPSRNTLQETYSAIVADLLKSADLMGSDKSSVYASKEVAWALLSRVYLYMGQNDKAIEYADKVINSGRYELANADNYKKYFTIQPENNPETIFAIKFAQKNDLGYGSIGSMYNADGGYGELYASIQYMKILNKHPEDLRHSFVAVQYKAGSTDTLKRNGDPKIFVFKFSNQGATSSMSSPAIIRLAEVYLNRAEANAKLGKNTEALADVNTVRARAAIPASALYTTGDLKGQPTVLDAVLEERQLELAFEGFRPRDLFRNNRTLTREYPGFHPLTDGNKQIIQPTNPRIIHLIPEQEIILNPNLKPNL